MELKDKLLRLLLSGDIPGQPLFKHNDRYIYVLHITSKDDSNNIYSFLNKIGINIEHNSNSTSFISIWVKDNYINADDTLWNPLIYNYVKVAYKHETEEFIQLISKDDDLINIFNTIKLIKKHLLKNNIDIS